MDKELINMMFKCGKFKPISIAGGTSNGYLNAVNKPTFGPRFSAGEKESLEDDVHITRQKLKKNLESVGKIDENAETPIEDIYEKYKFDRRTQNAMNLPIYASKNEILASIANCPAVVIEGSTGCGKSTQVNDGFSFDIFPKAIGGQFQSNRIRLSHYLCLDSRGFLQHFSIRFPK